MDVRVHATIYLEPEERYDIRLHDSETLGGYAEFAQVRVVTLHLEDGTAVEYAHKQRKRSGEYLRGPIFRQRSLAEIPEQVRTAARHALLAAVQAYT